MKGLALRTLAAIGSFRPSLPQAQPLAVVLTQQKRARILQRSLNARRKLMLTHAPAQLAASTTMWSANTLMRHHHIPILRINHQQQNQAKYLS